MGYAPLHSVPQWGKSEVQVSLPWGTGSVDHSASPSRIQARASTGSGGEELVTDALGG